jgi:choline-sulfatase
MLSPTRVPSRWPPLLFSCLVFTATLWGCGRAPRPDVVLITIDTLRPDALGWIGGSNATPAIDALAHEGFAFPSAVSPAPLTLPSHVSILTGLVPRRHGVRDNGQILAGSLPTLAERLGEAGYRTGAFISGYPLRRMFGLDRGFDTYQDELATRPDGRWQDRPAASTTAVALEWLRGIKKRDAAQPYFLWLHYYDPHAPYEPPERFARPGPRGDYDGEVAAVDAAVAALRRGLEEAFPRRPRLVVLTADHGESLGEHGEETHGFFVYDSTTIVPLLFSYPGQIAPGTSSAAARLVDLAPTLLELLGLAPLSETDGRSLAGFWKNRPFDVAPALIESRQPFSGYGWAPLTAWRTADAKWIQAPKPELYDLGKDAGELQNLAGKDARGEALQRELAGELRKPVLASPDASADPEVIAALRSLGYAGGTSHSTTEPPAGLADPKDRVRQKAQLDLAEDSLASGNPLEALALFDVVLASDPGNRYAMLRSGQTLVRLGQFAEAIPLLERLLALDPGQTEARFELADALGRSDKLKESISQWMQLLELQPRRAIAWSNMGALLVRSGELERGESAMTKALDLDNRNPVLRRNLGELRYRRALAAWSRKDLRAARSALLEAMEALPDLRLRAASDQRLAPLLEGSAASPAPLPAEK